MTRLSSRLLLQVLALVLVSACSEPEPTLGSARFSVTVPEGLAAPVARVTVTASSADFSPLSLDLTLSGSTWTGTLDNIPAGPLRTFRAQAFDAASVLLYDGTVSNVTITAQQTTLVALLLQDVNPPPPLQNEAPIIDSLVANTTTVLVGESLNLTVTAHDPNAGDTLAYAWSATGGTFSAPAAAATSWTAPSTTGLYTLTVTVTDSRGLATSANLAINVRKPQETGSAQLTITFNAPPTVTTLAASPTLLSVGQATAVTATATDADGDTLSYAWSASCAGSWTNPTARSAQFMPSALPGGACNNCRLTVAVADGRGASTSGTVALCVNNAPRINHFAPVIEHSYFSSDTATAGQVLNYEVVASDPESTALTFAWSANTGNLGTPTTSATSSRTPWTAPACAVTGVPTRVSATVTNAFSLTAVRDFSVTGLPACTSGSTATGALATARVDHTSTLLSNGRVLVTGGVTSNSTYTASAELYNPGTGTWSVAKAMGTLRGNHTETLLQNGNVLVTGGNSAASYYASAEVYDVSANTWTATSNTLSGARTSAAATLLPTGKVLVSGGFYMPNSNTTVTYLSADLYDPASNSWSATGGMSATRSSHTSTPLPNGKVLVVGGISGSSVLASTELYDAASGTWSTLRPLNTARYLHTTTVLPNGKVLVVGGYSGSATLASAELYDPATGNWTATGSMGTVRSGHQALLVNGKVLVVGGYNANTQVATAEQYDPAAGLWNSAASFTTARRKPTALRLPSGLVLLAGGAGTSGVVSSAELYLP